MDKLIFFQRYNIDNKCFEAAGLNWPDLEKIHDEYSLRKEELQINIQHIANTLAICERIHSTRIRVKSPDHLVEKIIRKQLVDSKRKIDMSNYQKEITDLMGVRALHLFKADWLEIDKFVRDKWNLFEENPTAYIREGDDSKVKELYAQNGCEIKTHEYGYRSVHYILQIPIGKKKMLPCELQIRTIFEEGWSEIDHKLRYPYEIGNKILEQYLAILNRLAGSADDMGTFILSLVNSINDSKLEKESLQASIEKLQKELDSIKMKVEQKREIQDELSRMVKAAKTTPSDSAFYHTMSNSGMLSAGTREYYNFMTQNCKRCGAVLSITDPAGDEYCSACRLLTSTSLAMRTCKSCGSLLSIADPFGNEYCSACRLLTSTRVAIGSCKKCGAVLSIMEPTGNEYCSSCRLLTTTSITTSTCKKCGAALSSTGSTYCSICGFSS